LVEPPTQSSEKTINHRRWRSPRSSVGGRGDVHGWGDHLGGGRQAGKHPVDSIDHFHRWSSEILIASSPPLTINIVEQSIAPRWTCAPLEPLSNPEHPP
jgi:hypothetical protein